VNFILVDPFSVWHAPVHTRQNHQTHSHFNLSDHIDTSASHHSRTFLTTAVLSAFSCSKCV